MITQNLRCVPSSIQTVLSVPESHRFSISARGLYRRWGLAPRPEDTVQLPTEYHAGEALSRNLFCGRVNCSLSGRPDGQFVTNCVCERTSFGPLDSILLYNWPNSIRRADTSDRSSDTQWCVNLHCTKERIVCGHCPPNYNLNLTACRLWRGRFPWGHFPGRRAI